VESLKENLQPVNVIDADPVLVTVNVFVPQKVPVGQPDVWSVIVFGLNESVTGTLVSSGVTELEGVATATPDGELTANTNGILPIANNATTETIRAEVTKIDFMAAGNCYGEY
jgi:hypothetical protein